MIKTLITGSSWSVNNNLMMKIQLMS